MPIVWMKISTATAPDIEPFRDNPAGLEAMVRRVAEIQGAEFLGLYFDVARPVAYAMMEHVDDFVDMRAIGRLFGADDVVKLVRVGQAAQAVEREQSIRRQLGRPYSGSGE